MDAIERKIIDEVEAQREDLIEFFRELVRFESITKHERGVAEHLRDGLAARGFTDVEIVGPSPDRPNVLGHIRGSEDGPTYYFNGHLDVLPPQENDEWEHPPFSADLEDGKIYGRGTVDMKAGTFSSFFAGLIIHKLNIPLRGSVLFTGVCDELISGDDGVLWLLKNGYIKKEHPDDFGINCEPTDMCEMNMATKGVYRADFVIQGKGAFGGRPYLGISAIDKAAKFILAMAEFNENVLKKRSHPLLEPPSVLCALIKGGEASNLVPDRCTITVTRRMHPGETVESVNAEYDAILAGLKKEDPEFSASYHPWKNLRPPVELPMDAPIVAGLRKALRTATGKELIQNGSEGGTDASHVVFRTGICMPVMGPGNYRIFGTNHEYVEADDFINMIKVYALSIYYMLGKKETEDE